MGTRVTGYATAVAFVVVAMMAGREMAFYTLLNDFWGLFYLGEHLSVADPRTLHNGFYPIGYPLLVRLLLTPDILITTFVVSVLSGAVMLAVLYIWLRSRVASPWPPLAATLLLALHPMFFQHALTAGPDMPAMLLGVSGVLLLWTALDRHRLGLAVLAGVLLGLSGLTRHHGFLLAAGAVLAAMCCRPRHWRVWSAAALAVGACGLVQVAINVWAGVPPFQTAQAFNVYKMFNPVDWFHLERNYPESVVDVVRLNPTAYWAAYKAQLLPSLTLLLPGAIAIAVNRGPLRMVAAYLLLTALVYLPLQATGGSPRGPLVVLPLAAAGVALILHAVLSAEALAWTRRPAIAAALTVVLVALPSLSWVPQNRAFVEANRDVRGLWAEVERRLRADGVVHAAQVFTDSFDFYFVTERSRRSWDYRPRNTGGWARIDMHGYDKVHPPLRTSSLDVFLADSRAHGVTHLVLTATAPYVLRDLGEIQAGRSLPAELRHVGDVQGVKILALQ